MKFGDWLKNNGYHADVTIQNYIYAINNLKVKFGFDDTTNNLVYIDSEFEKLKKNENFIEINKKQHHVFTAAMNQYTKYKKYCETVNRIESFKNQIPTGDVTNILSRFKSEYGKEALKQKHGKDLLLFIFGPKETNSIIYNVEFNNNYIDFAGGIKGGTSYKFTLFYSKTTNQWIYGKQNSSKAISEDEAIEYAEQVKTQFIKCFDYIETHTFESKKDYKNLSIFLKKSLNELLYLRGWISKYFYLLYPNVFFPLHAQAKYMTWSKNAFDDLSLETGNDLIIQHGDICLLSKDLKISTHHLYKILLEMYNKNDTTTYWFYFANPKIYNHNQAFKDNGFIDWNCRQRKHNIGDVIFIYSSGDEKRVRYKTEVVRINLSKKNIIDDQKYWIDSNHNYNKDDNFVRLKLIKETNSIKGVLENLRAHGYPYNMQTGFRLDNYPDLLEYISSIFDENDTPEQPNPVKSQEYDFESIIKSSCNKIIYGTPGCGKSYYVKHTITKNAPKENVVRTTFHQDYTNTDFVGQILPRVSSNKEVTYEFNPGPFTIALERAIRKPDEMIYLVIEEINRGNASSIFGDIFQLLDRTNGESEYEIINVNIQDYLNKQFMEDGYNFEYIKIPGNLSIIATMNTSDQNVFTLDNAFKRRWKMEKMKNDFSSHKYADLIVPGTTSVTWKKMVETVNKYIVSNSDDLLSEDKLLGVYFVNEETLIKDASEDSDNKKREFAYKVLEYLWDDVAKFDRQRWFGNVKTLDDLIDEYMKVGVGIFTFKDDFNSSDETK